MQHRGPLPVMKGWLFASLASGMLIPADDTAEAGSRFLGWTGMHGRYP